MNFNKKTLHTLKTDNDQIIMDRQEILNAITKYYKKLYHKPQKGPVATEYLNDMNIPKISESTKEKLEKPITQVEIDLAIKNLKTKKVPGTSRLLQNFLW